MKKCSFCQSLKVIKKGKRRNIQRYQCAACGANFQSKKRKEKLRNKIRDEYIYGKQTANDLSRKYKRSRKWILSQLNEINADDNKIINISPQPIVVVADATFFSRSYGVLIFREPNLKRNLIWKEIHQETAGQYEQLKIELEYLGFNIKAVVLDGKRGIRQIFSGVPIQMCQFHQAAIINRYLTRRPILEAGKELRQIALQLTSSNEDEFTRLLNDWHIKWHEFLKEKTIHPITNKWSYTHRRIRSAYGSLKTNLPYLFTYQRFPKLNIPNTTNSLDGNVTTLKNLIRIHRGINQKNRYKMICQILKK